MDKYLVSRAILKRIIDEDQNFAFATKQELDNQVASDQEKRFVRALVSCELHHHLVISFIVERDFPDMANGEKQLLYLAIANAAFLRTIEHAEVMSFLRNYFGNYKNDVDLEKINALLVAFQDSQDIVPDDVDRQSEQYLSLKYNTPEWLVKMWTKHLGRDLAERLMIANTRPVAQACRVNTLKVTTDDIIARQHGFERGPVNDTVIYRGKVPLKMTAEYRNFEVFQQRFAVSEAIETGDYSQVTSCLIYEERPHAMHLDLAIKEKQAFPIHLAVPTMERRLDVKKILTDHGFESINVFESTAPLLITHIRDEQDCVVCIPDCSKFDLIRTVPDFLLHFKQSSIDQIIFQERRALEECAAFVRKGGALLYGINTVNHKEGHALIVDFLKDHPDYVLIEERQFLPFDRYNSTLYTAHLRRNEVVPPTVETEE